MKPIPHLNHIRSFEAVARHLSFTLAAKELNYTRSAVSNHVRSLEGFIGRPLFTRKPHGLALTNIGEAFLPTIQSSLVQIDTAAETIISSRHGKRVSISCPMSLAENWLADCINAFQKRHSDIGISVHGTIWEDIEQSVADIRITINNSDMAPSGARKMWPEEMTVVCAPNYRVQGRRLMSGNDLLEADLIHIIGRPDYWCKIADQFNLGNFPLDTALQTNASNIALELSTRGLGCCALPKSLVQTYVERDLLIEPIDMEIECPWAYFISDFDATMSRPAKILYEWINSYIISR
ncbi:LysR substrate-binding domain-containing protein [Leisingera sp. ANG-Vp]|uniref:LysR substrate-binding domain-containing protein n=1 Tax=Leisingera sp. ANG-Vp TaxID=1577896 RepID=UPI0005802710|nr:LysR substrate-binding domain-containing protein [Leisingera sp. ANG-Vp]KIC14312.1 hypothetical protein RA20_20985 [Leisingera sp. ANG-Vp]